MSDNCIKVAIKVRPLIPREKSDNATIQWTVDDAGVLYSISRNHKFAFDRVFDEKTNNGRVFEEIAKPIITNALNGINGTIFAYGQTSSGKTHCMSGTDEDPGIVPLTVAEIFKQINTTTMEDREFLIRVGYIEIYNEKIFDLLDLSKPEVVRIFEPTQGEVKISQVEVMISSAEIMIEHFHKGNNVKRTGETAMNERSSRSHAIFSITIESKEKGSSDGEYRVSTLNLVDLAGSERADQTKATGERLNESKHINQSLLALGKVIRDLSENEAKHINYRDSKLTRLLSASLGGNAKTAIICTVTPAAIEETLSTLNFASNAKTIKNKPKVNHILSDRVIMVRLEKEIEKLKNQLMNEKFRNSELERITQLKHQITERENQIIHGHSSKAADINRRRTWMCPSTIDEVVEVSPQALAPAANVSSAPPFMLRNTEDGPMITFCLNDDNPDETFMPGTEVDFDEPFPSMATDEELARRLRTPRALKKPPLTLDSPEIIKPSDMTKDDEIRQLQKLNQYLKDELSELEEFKKLEDYCNDEVHKEYEILKCAHHDLFDKVQTLNDELSVLHAENKRLQETVHSLKELETKMQLADNERRKALKERQESENILASMRYEYDLFRQKTKTREEELVQELNNARDHTKLLEKVKSLEDMLRSNEQELNTLQATKSALTDDSQHKLAQMTDLIKGLESKLEAEKKARLAAETIVKEFEATSDQLMDSLQDNEKLTKDIEDIKDVLSGKVLKIQELQDQLSANEETILRFKAIQEMLQDTQEEDDIGKTITKLIKSTSKTESLEVENQQLMQEIEEMRNHLLSLNDKLMANQTLTETENEKIETLTEQLEECTFKIQDQEDQITELKAKNEDLSQRYASLLTSKNDLLIRSDQMNEEYAGMKKTLNAYMDNLKATERECDLKNEELHALKKTFDEQSSEYAAQCENISREHKAAIATKAELQTRLDQAIAELDESKKAQAELQEKLQASKEETPSKQELQANFDQIVAELHTIKENRNELMEKLQAAQRDCDLKNEELLALKKTVDDQASEYAAKCESAMKDFVATLASNTELQTRLDQATAELYESKEAQVELEKKLQVSKEGTSENNAILSSKQELQANFDQIAAELLTIKENRNELMEKLQAAQNDCEVKNEELLALKKTVDDQASEQLLALNTELQTRLDQATAELDESKQAQAELQEKWQALSKECAEKDKKVNSIARKSGQMLQKIEMAKGDQELAFEKDRIEWTKDLECMQSHNDSLASTVEGLLERCHKYDADLDEKRDEIRQTKQLLEEATNKLNRASPACEHKETATESDLEDKRMMEKLTLLQTNYDTVLALKADLEKTASEYLSKLTSVQSELDAEIAVKKDLEMAVQRLSEKCVELDKNIQNSTKLYETSQQEMECLVEENMKLFKEADVATSAKSALEDELKSLRLRHASEQETQKSHNEDFAKELQECESKINMLESEVRDLTAKNDDLILVIDQKNAVNGDLEAKVDQLTELCRRLEDEGRVRADELMKKTAEFNEMANKYSCIERESGQKLRDLEGANSKLKKNIDANEAAKLSVELQLKKLKNDYSKLLNQFNSLFEENSQVTAKNRQYELESSQLKVDIDQFKRECEDLKRQMKIVNESLAQQTSLNFANEQKISELQLKNDNLTGEVEIAKSQQKKSSPTQNRRSGEAIENEAFALQHKQLHIESNHGTPVRAMKSNQNRKTRRQSVYDENRRLSDWELTSTAETQTENVSELCACKEYAKKIRDLEIELRKKQMIINNAERMAKCHPLKIDLADMKMKYDRELSANKVLKASVESLEEQLGRERSAKSAVDYSQYVPKFDYEKLLEDKSTIEKKLAEVKRQIKHSEEKENVGVNTSHNIAQVDTVGEMNALREAHEILVRKYDKAKQLCNLRYEDIQTLRRQITSLDETSQGREREFERINRKYQEAKRICLIRMDKIVTLREQLGEKPIDIVARTLAEEEEQQQQQQ